MPMVSRSMCATTTPSPTENLPAVFDVTKENFNEIMKSPVPVILDCHAEWCGPCKQLAPMLEAIVNHPAAAGKIRLAKLDTDAEPELTQGLKVKSLPSVFGIHNRKMVDSFVGMQDPARIQEFATKLLQMAGAAVEGDGPAPPAEVLSMVDKHFEAGDIEQAKILLQTLVGPESEAGDEHKAAGYAGLARCFVKEGNQEAAEEMIEVVKKSFANQIHDSAVTSAIAAVSLAGKAPAAGELSQFQERLDIDEQDHEARHGLAMASAAMGDYETAINELLVIVRKDRDWNEGAAKDELLQIFETLGADNQVVKVGRARLTNFLFV